MTGLRVAQGISAYQNQRAQAKAQQQQYEQNRLNAAQARDDQAAAERTRADQEMANIEAERREFALESLRRQASMKVAAGEAGIGGAVLDALIDQQEAERLRNDTALDTQADNINAQMELQARGLDAQMLNRIGSVQQGVPPDPLGSVIGIAADAANTYNAYGGKMPWETAGPTGASGGGGSYTPSKDMFIQGDI